MNVSPINNNNYNRTNFKAIYKGNAKRSNEVLSRAHNIEYLKTNRKFEKLNEQLPSLDDMNVFQFIKGMFVVFPKFVKAEYHRLRSTALGNAHDKYLQECLNRRGVYIEGNDLRDGERLAHIVYKNEIPYIETKDGKICEPLYKNKQIEESAI